MTAQGPRRPVTARDFNRLLFALLLLGALTVLARLITRQDSHAATSEAERITMAQWVQTADALFMRGAWELAADAYFSALEVAADTGVDSDPRLLKKLALSLYSQGERRVGIHFMHMYAVRLQQIEQGHNPAAMDNADPLLDPQVFTEELAFARAQLADWTAAE